MSNDTFRQLKDRRKNRSRQLADKNSGPSGILRFGSLSVKVKKTTEAFNNYFNHSEKKHSQDNQPYSLPTIGNVQFLFIFLRQFCTLDGVIKCEFCDFWRFFVFFVNFGELCDFGEFLIILVILFSEFVELCNLCD